VSAPNNRRLMLDWNLVQPFTQRNRDGQRDVSTGDKCPAPWISNSVACGILRRMVSCCDTGDQVSSLPLSSRVGDADRRQDRQHVGTIQHGVDLTGI